MLSSTTVFARDGVEIADVACRHPAGRGQHTESAGARALVFVRRGCFVRSVDGVDPLLDSTVAYAMNPGEEQRYDHPHAHGDDCTVFSLDGELAASLWGEEPILPSGPLPVPPGLDLEHRLLLVAARRQADAHELHERVILLGARLLEVADPQRVASARPQTASRRLALVDEAREALADEPEVSLLDLAKGLAVSPHHLSRIFHTATGRTIARHRIRLRVRDALERLAGGERDLARLAADLGLADHSHLCRIVRDETGTTPSVLRSALSD